MEATNAPSVVCLGFFDGVHQGHLSLLKAAKEIAREKGLIVCAHTFDRSPGKKDFPLTSLARREALLRAAGADWVAVSPFDEEMRHMSGDAFFRQIVAGRLNARHVVCGDDHHANLDALHQLKLYCPIQGPIDVRAARGMQDAFFFGQGGALFTPELVMKQSLNRLARQMHALYRAQANAPVPPWEGLSDFLKRSNFAAADHQAHPLKDLLALHGGVQALDFQ